MMTIGAGDLHILLTGGTETIGVNGMRTDTINLIPITTEMTLTEADLGQGMTNN